MTETKSENVVWQDPAIPSWDLETLNGHKGATIWFTGLFSSGKSTLANALAKELLYNEIHIVVLDGDNIRHGLNKNLGFSPADLTENIRRIAEVSKLFSSAGIITLTASVSPYRTGREAARKMQPGRFIEVHCCAPLDVCEERDTVGLYKKARAGELRPFIGIDEPYQPPEDPEITVDTATFPVEVCVETVIDFIEERGIARVGKRIKDIPETVYTD